MDRDLQIIPMKYQHLLLQKEPIASAVYNEFSVISISQSYGKRKIMQQNLYEILFDNFEWVLYIILLGGIAAIK